MSTPPFSSRPTKRSFASPTTARRARMYAQRRLSSDVRSCRQSQSAMSSHSRSVRSSTGNQPRAVSFVAPKYKTGSSIMPIPLSPSRNGMYVLFLNSSHDGGISKTTCGSQLVQLAWGS